MDSRIKVVLSLFFVIVPGLVYGDTTHFLKIDKEGLRTDFMINFVSSSLMSNGWTNIICVGTLPNAFYTSVGNLNLTLTVLDPTENTEDIGPIVPYSSNIVILHCKDFDEFEQALLKTMASPYWHPHAHVILYYDVKHREDIPKIFIIFWYYKACNAIILQYNDEEETTSISFYNPYISKSFKLAHLFGCWKAMKVSKPVRKFKDSFVCVEGCQNVTLHSKLRAHYLGTCIGFDTYEISYDNRDILKIFNPFDDKSKNLHGFVMRGFAGEIQPFLTFTENSDGTFTSTSRDGMLWNVASKIMNFKIDLNASKEAIKSPFNFGISLQQIFEFARREADLVLYPIYQFDVFIVEIDLSIAYKDSGVCILAHRAGFETVLFDVKLLQDNYELLMKFLLCFSFIWILFYICNVAETGVLSFDQAGKDFVNAIRSVLSITIYRPPKWGSFRIYLFVSIWAFFVLNFATQAAIISFFTAYKRGKEVDTFEDMIEKGYPVEGIATPDMMLPDTEERFRKINSMLVPIKDYSECVDRMLNDSRRFCLLDCSVGYYLARNRLNQKGEQYLRITKDRIHGYYLCTIFHKHSHLTKTFNKYFRIFSESGLLMKWEQYKFNDVKPEIPVKALNLADLIGIFKCYCLLLGLSSFIFAVEVIIGLITRMKRFLGRKIAGWKIARVAKHKREKLTN